MKVKFGFQSDNTGNIKELIETFVLAKPKKIYCVFGKVDETGVQDLDCIFTGLKSKITYVIGVDRKNTTKNMLELLMSNTSEVYIYNNNGQIELSSQLIIFEYAGEAKVLMLPSDVTSTELVDNYVMYSAITYDLKNADEKIQYDEYIKAINNLIKQSEIKKLDKDYIDVLLTNKDIFSMKQYEHNLMSIEEYKKNNGVEKLIGNVQKASKKLKDKLDTKFDIAIDVGDDDVEETQQSEQDVDIQETFEIEHVAKSKKKIDSDLSQMIDEEDELFNDTNDEKLSPSEETLDIENMLFEKADIKLDKQKAVPKVENIAKTRKIDINKVTNLIMQLPSKPTKGKDVANIKIPNYIRELVPNFFEIMEETKIEKTPEGNAMKKGEIRVELVDINSNTRIKSKGYMYQQDNQTYIAMHINELEDINYEELDIVRIIKVEKDCYHVEIIPQTTEEYLVWDKLCTQEFRGSERRYGLI